MAESRGEEWVYKLMLIWNWSMVLLLVSLSILNVHREKSHVPYLPKKKNSCTYDHGCQNPDLNLTILQFYDPTYPKQSGSFKDFCDRSRSYDFDDHK